MWTIFCLYWICYHVASILCLGRGLETLWRVKKKVNSVQLLSRVSLWPRGLQHARLPCPSSTPGACSNSHPLSRWCHPTISSSVISFSSRLQSFPASGSFQMSQFFTAGGQSIGVSASTSILPVNIQDYLIAVKGTLKSLLQHHSSKVSILWHSAFFMVQLWLPYMTTGKP